jgi:hypothetical protein
MPPRILNPPRSCSRRQRGGGSLAPGSEGGREPRRQGRRHAAYDGRQDGQRACLPHAAARGRCGQHGRSCARSRCGARAEAASRLHATGPLHSPDVRVVGGPHGDRHAVTQRGCRYQRAGQGERSCVAYCPRVSTPKARRTAGQPLWTPRGGALPRPRSPSCALAPRRPRAWCDTLTRPCAAHTAPCSLRAPS